MKNFRVLSFLLLSFLFVTTSNCSDDYLSGNQAEESINDVVTAEKGRKNQSASRTNSNSNNTGVGTKLNLTTQDENNSYSVYSHSLWAGKDSYAGKVIVTNNDRMLIITYDTDMSADLGEVHVYVWDDESVIPKKRPAPGQAPYTAENLNSDTYTLLIPEELVCGKKYYISTHTALVTNRTDEPDEEDEDGNEEEEEEEDDESDNGNNDDDPDFKVIASHSNAGETAYAGGTGFSSQKGAWWGYFEYVVECSDSDDDDEYDPN